MSYCRKPDSHLKIAPIADAMEKGGRKAAARAVTDDVLKKACPIAGTPDECSERIEEYRQAGCTNIMLEIWGDDREEQARLFLASCATAVQDLGGKNWTLMLSS